MAAVSLDGPLGTYAGADIAIAAGGDSPRMTMNSQYAGIALRTGEVSLELGAIHRHYRDNYDVDYNPAFFEGYIGVVRRKTKLRVYVSPDYLRDGRTTYYAEFETQVLKLGKWSLDAHGGLSAIPQDIGSGEHGLRIYEDWSLSMGREIKGFALNVAIASSNYPVIGPSGKTRIYAAISRAF